MDLALLTWIGIAGCLVQSGTLSGLNLALFSISYLELEVLAATGDRAAAKLLGLRAQSNFLLATILWANVASNVLLTLLSDSMLTGIGAFVFSTFVITLGGEIVPQAYFSRHVLAVADRLAPIIKVYQVLLYPLARPTAALLDACIGRQGIQFFREREMREVIRRHIAAEESDVGRVEGLGALNFLALDDLRVTQEGETVDPGSVVRLPVHEGRPVFPEIARAVDDPFVQRIQRSGRKWVIITTPQDEPVLALNTAEFLRAALFAERPFNPYACCHRPVIVRDGSTRLGDVVAQLRVYPEHPADDVIDHDIILVWAEDRRVITGADILGRLLRGIAQQNRGPGGEPSGRAPATTGRDGGRR